MYKNIYVTRSFLAVILFLIVNNTIPAQQNIDIDNQFKQAVNLYQSGEYKKALPIFNNIATQLPFNPKTTAAYIFIGKSYLELNDLNNAEQFLLNYLNKYPLSKYTDEVRLSLVKVYYSKEEYTKAFGYLLNLISDTGSPEYKKYALSLGEKLAADYLGLQELKIFSDSTSYLSSKPFLLLVIGEKEEKEGNYNLALKTYQDLIDAYPGSEQVDTARKLIEQLGKIKSDASSEELLAVLLPLNDDKTGEKINAAEEILEGIKYATSKYNADHEKKIGLIIRDTGNDSLKIEEIQNEISMNPSIKAIIGPIFSNEVRFTLEDFRPSGIPVISPTATDDDLTGVSNYFFQANPSFSMRGKVIAQYIYYVAGKRNMAVINAEQGYSPSLARAFIQEFEKIGGNIVVTSSYISGTFDLKLPVSVVEADSERVDGIYLPLSNKMDATSLLSQMVQQNINLPLFGNQDWFFAKGFESSSVLSNQLSFTSDFFMDFNDSAFVSFSKDFVNQGGIDINRNILYGYDTANYLLTLISAGADSRYSLVNAMESGIEVKGYHNDIAFGKEHINRFLNIVRYHDGKFELVDRFKSGE